MLFPAHASAGSHGALLAPAAHPGALCAPCSMRLCSLRGGAAPLAAVLGLERGGEGGGAARQRRQSLATDAHADAGQGGGGAATPAKRPWGLLALLLSVYVHNQWSRNALQYSVNFAVAPSADAAREFVNIAMDISKAEYAVLASYAFILLYTVFSLLSGRVADTTSRPKTLAVASAAWSLAVLASCDIFVYMH